MRARDGNAAMIRSQVTSVPPTGRTDEELEMDPDTMLLSNQVISLASWTAPSSRSYSRQSVENTAYPPSGDGSHIFG